MAVANFPTSGGFGDGDFRLAQAGKEQPEAEQP
jgi:hypothetical protein